MITDLHLWWRMGPLQDFSVKDINLTQLRICQQWVLDVLIIFVLLCPLVLPLTLHDILDVNVAELHVLHIWRQITHIHSQSKRGGGAWPRRIMKKKLSYWINFYIGSTFWLDLCSRWGYCMKFKLRRKSLIITFLHLQNAIQPNLSGKDSITMESSQMLAKAKAEGQ